LIYNLVTATPVLQFNKLKELLGYLRLYLLLTILQICGVEYRDSLIFQIAIHQLIHEDFKDK